MAKTIYIIPGLGTDERIFKNLSFPSQPVNFIRWIEPEKNESLQAYVYRLKKQINDSHPILIGFSFGGMVAIELCRQMEVGQLILISSVKSKHELPFYYRLFGLLQLNKLVPTAVFRKASLLTNWFFGVESPEDKRMLKEIMRAASPTFVRWAVHQVVNWRNEFIPEEYTHVHGTNDRMLPCRNIHITHPVKNSGHLMVLNRSEEISNLLREIICTR